MIERQTTDHNRRHILQMGTSLAAWGLLPRISSAASAHDPRFLLIILRGGLDGISAVMPTADPDYSRIRGKFLDDIRLAGTPFKLDGSFALNPNLKTLSKLYSQRQALILHAISTPYRERSHFDGQEVLESGFAGVSKQNTGWLNRAVDIIQTRERINGNIGLAIGHSVPLVMRGSAGILSWAPQLIPQSSADTLERLQQLYDHTDPQFASALKRGADLDSLTGSEGMMQVKRGKGRQSELLSIAKGAANLLSKPDGARIAVASLDGWDTHANEKPGSGRLARLLSTLDAIFEILATELTPVWKQTVIAVVTEFGRTVHINGTAGTDHGTGTVAFLAGGAVNGGRVVTNWPGLSRDKLYQGRDLNPTLDLRSVFKAILINHLDLPKAHIDRSVFPDSSVVIPLQDIIS